jgi:bifunctional oligoribonuclease and PAP phosphatase NrnA
MNTEQSLQLQTLLQTPQKVVIIPHRNPDGDAMGSTLALYHLLIKLGHDAVVMTPNEFPNNLAFLPGSETVQVFEKNKVNTTKIMKEATILFTLDFNALHRTGEMEEVLKTLKAPFVMIDHHEEPSEYATITFSDTSYGSTCEMIYDTMVALGKEELIDETIATCLYTGITTDSGSFRFPKTTPKTHRTVANLIEKGVKNFEVHNKLFDNNSYSSLQLLGRALQNMKVLHERKTAYITLSQEELDTFHYHKGDTEGFVNYGLSIKGIIFAVIFIENKEENIIKISLRSQGNFDVNELAREHFNGGGHRNAAGGRSFASMEETVLNFLKIINEHPDLQ